MKFVSLRKVAMATMLSMTLVLTPFNRSISYD